MEEELYKGFTVHQPPHGFVRYIDHLGSDARVLEAARLSYKSPSKGEEADRKLLNYLFRMRHTSPFEQCSATYNIRFPVFLMRQFVRHRTFRLNEWSGRYSELEDKFYEPISWRKQDVKNKQGSVEEEDNPITRNWNASNTRFMQKAYETAYACYQTLLERGVAKEMARFVLPVGVYTEIYVNCDLHNLMHFLRLRLDPHAQKEIRDVAIAMHTIAKRLFPWSLEAFERYQMKMVDTQALNTPPLPT